MIERPLGELLEILIDRRGKTPKKLGGDFVPVGIPVASAVNVKSGRLVFEGAPRCVTPEMFERWMPVRLRAGDVLLTSEAPLGEVARVVSDEPLVLGQRLFGLRGPADVVDSGYLYYALQWRPIQDRLLARATGTTVHGIRQSELVRVSMPVSSLAQQRAIVDVLGALDDKIENSRTIAHRAAKLALAEGQAILADPRGPIVSLSSVANIRKGVSYRSEDLVEGGRYLVSLKCVSRNGSFQLHGLKPYRGEYRPEQVVEQGDIVVAQTDLTQRAEVIGRPVRVQSVGAKYFGL